MVAVASHGEAFEEFRTPANGLFERFQVIFIMAADSEMRKDVDRKAELAGIEQHRTPRDNSRCFKLLQSAPAGSL